MDLLAKTIITPPKIILNSEYLPHNLKATEYALCSFIVITIIIITIALSGRIYMAGISVNRKQESFYS